MRTQNSELRIQNQVKDTLRLIITLECNLSCPYCCNNIPEFKNQFVKKSFNEIDFSKYKNVCITGGEPFTNKMLLYKMLFRIPYTKNIYIYSNGLLINDVDIFVLNKTFNLKAINIGLHYSSQINSIQPDIENKFNVRFRIEDKKVYEFLDASPRLRRANVKGYKLNDCNMPNEDWILLNDCTPIIPSACLVGRQGVEG